MSFTEQIFNLPTDPTGKCKISVFRPDTPHDYPILIWSYGGGLKFSQRYPSYVEFKKLLAEAGIMVVTYDYRGMCGDRDFCSTSLETRISDLMGASWLVRSHYPDNELVLGGNSMGGYVTVASLPYQVRSSAIVLLAPAAYHWQAKYANFGPQFSEIIRRREGWKDSDAFLFLGAAMFGSRMLICCQNDKVVLPEITDEYTKRAYLDESEIVFLPGGHRVFAEETRVSAVANLIKVFLEKNYFLNL